MSRWTVEIEPTDDGRYQWRHVPVGETGTGTAHGGGERYDSADAALAGALSVIAPPRADFSGLPASEGLRSCWYAERHWHTLSLRFAAPSQCNQPSEPLRSFSGAASAARTVLPKGRMTILLRVPSAS